MNLAYAADMAYYTYAIPYCIFFETKRKDFWATFLHHIVTVALIGYSFCLGLTKVGVVIMFLHDICDPWLEVAKLSKYAGAELATNTLFVIFTITWIAMRVVYFPLWVIHSAVFDAYDTIKAASGAFSTSFPHWGFLCGMLVILWVLHVFWTYVILKIAMQAISQGSADDSREKDE
jgi:ceramide synthetase